ncbi:MAG: PEP-CTERM sorting domain-containing protein [Desulfobacter sp.]
MKHTSVKILLYILLASFLCTLPALATPFAYLNLVDSGDIYTGDNFDLEVRVNDSAIGEDFLAFGFDLFNSGNTFALNSYVIGPDFDDDSLLVPMDVAGSMFPGTTDDSVLLATLSFNATSAGTETFQVLGLADWVFSGLAYESVWYDINASLDITVHQANPIPEPATMLLCGIGLIAFAGALRRNIKG